MNEKALLTALSRSGKSASKEQVEGLFSRLNFLESRRRYGLLLKNLETANDENNFAASVLEATIAFQFESAGFELEYEVNQDQDNESSIDFRWRTSSGKTVYIEARFLQQDRATTDSIERQLQTKNVYEVSKDGDDEKRDIIRVQQVILEKVQKRNGTPTKFLTTHRDAFNVVAVDVSQIILRMFDSHDCKLVTEGDPAVPPVCRRDIFGLFQNPSSEYSEQSKSFSHIRETLHGVLFLFKKPRGESFNYSLERFLAWNPNLVDKDSARAICSEIEPALPRIKHKP